MIARPGPPCIHDGTEFELQGFKNRVGEATAEAFFEFLPRQFDGGPCEHRFGAKTRLNSYLRS